VTSTKGIRRILEFAPVLAELRDHVDLHFRHEAAAVPFPTPSSSAIRLFERSSQIWAIGSRLRTGGGLLLFLSAPTT